MSSQRHSPPLRSRAASPLRLLWLLAGVIAASGCALLQRSGDTLPGPVRVRVGKIDEEKLHASLTDVPASTSLRVENLFDLFWDAGCAGEHLQLSPAPGDGYPDVVCRLPGRSRESILVVAHVGGDGADDEWASAASLAPLYRALAKERRAHTFVFAGLGQLPRGGVLRGAQLLAETLEADAIVTLTGLGTESDVLGCLASDARLREGFARVGLQLGLRAESLRLFTPPADAQPSLSRPPTMAIGRLAPGDRRDPDVGASGERHELVDDLRVIAVLLGYLDHILTPAEPARG